MATRRITRKEMKRDEFVSALGRFTQWAEEHAREALILFAVVVGAVIGSVFLYQYLGQREEKAAALLGRGIAMMDATIQGANAPPGRNGASSFATEDERDRAVLDQMDSILQTYPRSRAGRLALYYRGLALDRLHRAPEAIKALQEFLDQDPSNFAAPMAKASLARLLDDTGEHSKAIQLYQELSGIQGGPYPPQAALLEWARCLERMGNKEEAREIYRRLTREYPGSEYSKEAEDRLKELT